MRDSENTYDGDVEADREASKDSKTENNEFADLPPIVFDTVIDKQPFLIFVSITTLANVFVIGFEADYGCLTCKMEDRLIWWVVENLFTLLFMIEMGIRFYAYGPLGYFRGGLRRTWKEVDIKSVIDFIFIFLRVLDTWPLTLAGQVTNLKLLSLFRVVHIARLVKTVRTFPAFRELWLIVTGMGDVVKTLAWVSVLLGMMIWSFAILLTIGAESQANEIDYSNSKWGAVDYWGSVPKSMYSLFQILTRDKWWDSLVGPMVRRYPGYIIIFLTFYCIAGIGLLNIIVAVIVESTLAVAEQNSEREGKERAKQHKMVMDSLQSLFEEADTDGDGHLDREELLSAWKKKHVRDRMKMLGIKLEDLELLFGLLDEAKTDRVPTEKFFRGCYRLLGPASLCDLHRVSVDLNRCMKRADELTGITAGNNKRLKKLLNDIEMTDREIIKGEADEKDPVLVARRQRNRRAGAGSQTETHSNSDNDNAAFSSSFEAYGNLSLRNSAQASEISDHDIQEFNPRGMKKIGDNPPPAPGPPPMPMHLQVKGGQAQRAIAAAAYAQNANAAIEDARSS
eukprot:gnl/TRDRNA2_/TRDRNA2_181720_c0_seq1.p1 gnl/TRDRNA2_/TRDRNA2_181720_c0~~gnl/TRDRNA2_/TRDRNA2_181720_c0_seq1.p1  ORF type:complete len:566 (-),score=100.31 gnl/TRDRNA2_/TRDRNA2_181720_c0_seq1:108-1805(-)